jgi:hypothetical protein
MYLMRLARSVPPCRGAHAASFQLPLLLRPALPVPGGSIDQADDVFHVFGLWKRTGKQV